MKHKMEDMWNGAAAKYAGRWCWGACRRRWGAHGRYPVTVLYWRIAPWHAAALLHAPAHHCHRLLLVEWVIDQQLTKGLYPNFESLLVPALQGRQGARILDIASASGEPSATLAAALPQAQVLATDFVAPYLEIGRARAARLGLTNLQFEQADGENLTYGDASFDALTCSLGLMFMPSFRKALAEAARVLKPGGIYAATVWQAEEQVPFFRLAKEVAAEYDAASAPAAGSSIAVRFGDPAELLEAIRGVFGGAVECRVLQVEFGMAPGMWWQEVLDMPLPIKASKPLLLLLASAAALWRLLSPAAQPVCCCQHMGSMAPIIATSLHALAAFGLFLPPCAAADGGGQGPGAAPG